MPQGRSSRSRNGCFSCRRRKVRCDEQKPSCNACSRLGLDCQFQSASDNSRGNTGKVFKFVNSNHNRRARKPRQSIYLSTRSHGEPSPRSTSSQREMQVNQEANETISVFSGTEIDSLDLRCDPPFGLGDAIDIDEYGMLEYTALQMIADQNDTLHLPFYPNDENLACLSNPALQTPGLGDLCVNGESQCLQEDPKMATKTSALSGLDSDGWESLQHYLHTMVKFSKLRGSSDDNIYCYLFTHMASNHAPLLEAILAWASLHLSHTKKLSSAAAEARQERALLLLYEDPKAFDHIDLTLVTIWLLLQFELLLAERVDRFCRLLGFATSAMERLLKNNDVQAAITRLGPVAVRVLVWLSAYDSRATYFGDAGKFLGCLMRCPYVYELIDSSSRSFQEMTAKSSNAATCSPDVLSLELRSIHRSSLRLKFVCGQIILLGRWQVDGSMSNGWHSVRMSIKKLGQEVEQHQSSCAKAALAVATGSLNAMSIVSEREYNYLLVLASYYASIILYYQHRPEVDHRIDGSAEQNLPSIESCAARIIRLGQRVSIARPDSPQSVWLLFLFLAGIETRDAIYQHWVVERLKQAEIWGPNIIKTRSLLEDIIKRQNQSQWRFDFVAVMEETTGCFII